MSDSILYGIHAVEEILAQRSNEIDRIYFDSEHTRGNIFNLLKQCKKQKIPYQCIPSQKLNQIANTTKHQGVVAQCAIKPYDDIVHLMDRVENSDSPPLLVIPASCEDPRNFGALIRTSVAFGVTALLLERKKTAPLNATVAKASAGMVEHLSIVKPQNLEKTVIDLKTMEFNVIGAVAGNNKKPQEINFTKPTILIIGGEHRGIPPYLQKLCSDFVSIPITETAGSLNVSVAASILIYECMKQRGFSLL